MSEEKSLGSVRIAPNVLVTIAQLTTLSVPGVARMSAGALGSVRRLFDRGSNPQGVHVEVRDDAVWVEVHVIVQAGSNMYQVGTAIQHQVAQAIDQIVGMPVGAVHVYIEDVE